MRKTSLHLTLGLATLLSPAAAPPAAAMAPGAAPRTAAVQEQDEEEPELDPAVVESLVERLTEALKKGEPVLRLALIEEAASLPHEDVAKVLGKALKDDALDICRAALGVLGSMPVERALDELITFYKKDKRLKKDAELLAATLKEIGRHGSPAAIDTLKEDIFKDLGKPVLRARLFGLGNIRTEESVVALIDLMKSAAPKQVQPMMPEFRLALARLTGADHGNSQHAWVAWWNDNKRDLEVSETPPELDKELQRIWDKYWGLRKPGERGDEREDRGGDDGR